MAKLSDFQFFMNDHGHVAAIDKDGNEYAIQANSGKFKKMPPNFIDPYWGGATIEDAKRAVSEGERAARAS